MDGIGARLIAGMLLVLGGVGPSLAQVDADAALALAKRNDCFKCHAIGVSKKAPPSSGLPPA